MSNPCSLRWPFLVARLLLRLGGFDATSAPGSLDLLHRLAGGRPATGSAAGSPVAVETGVGDGAFLSMLMHFAAVRPGTGDRQPGSARSSGCIFGQTGPSPVLFSAWCQVRLRQADRVVASPDWVPGIVTGSLLTPVFGPLHWCHRGIRYMAGPVFASRPGGWMSPGLFMPLPDHGDQMVAICHRHSCR